TRGGAAGAHDAFVGGPRATSPRARDRERQVGGMARLGRLARSVDVWSRSEQERRSAAANCGYSRTKHGQGGPMTAAAANVVDIETSDTHLVAKAPDGDRAALEALFRRHAHPARGAAPALPRDR